MSNKTSKTNVTNSKPSISEILENEIKEIETKSTQSFVDVPANEILLGDEEIVELPPVVELSPEIDNLHNEQLLNNSKRRLTGDNTLVVQRKWGHYTSLSAIVSELAELVLYNGSIVWNVTDTRFDQNGERTKVLLGYVALVDGKPMALQPYGDSLIFAPKTGETLDFKDIEAIKQYNHLMALVASGKAKFGTSTFTSVVFATHHLKDEMSIIKMVKNGELPTETIIDTRVLKFLNWKENIRNERKAHKDNLKAFALARQAIEK